MNSFTRTFASLLLLAGLAAPAAGVETSDALWAVEFSGRLAYTQHEFEAMNDNITGRAEYWSGPNYPTTASTSYEEFEPSISPDLRLGLRYWRFHAGAGYVDTREQTGSVTAELTTFGTDKYWLRISSREFLGYLGYHQPLSGRLEVGISTAYGMGFVKGFVFDDRVTNDALRGQEVEVEGTYPTWRAEARIRYHITFNIALDLVGGYRYSTDTDPEANPLGLVGTGDAFYTVDGEPVQIDWSGPYVGLGITLKHPYED